MPAESIPFVVVVCLGFLIFMGVLGWQQWSAGKAEDDERS